MRAHRRASVLTFLHALSCRRDINGDGTTDPSGGAVRAAIQDFAASKHRQIQVSYKELGWWTWCVRR
jgi:hypothetical protein